ncbi:MAG: hypothetical protein RLZZ458_675 [Planctomycetota bacterium]
MFTCRPILPALIAALAAANTAAQDSPAAQQQKLTASGLAWAIQEQPQTNLLFASGPFVQSVLVLEAAAAGETQKEFLQVVQSAEGKPILPKRDTLQHLGAPLVPSAGFSVTPNGEYGLRISEDPQPGSPAWDAGLRAGDLVFSVNQKPVQDVESFQSAVLQSGDSAELGVFLSSTGLVDEDLLLRTVRERAGGQPSPNWPARMTTAVWLHSDLTLSPEFQSLLQDSRHIRLAVPQGNSPTEIAASIRDSLQDFPDVQPPPFPERTSFVLLTAMQINLRWRKPFNPRLTKPGSFRAPDGVIQANFIQAVDSFRYATSSKGQLLDLPTSDSSLFCRLILPVADIPTGADLETLLLDAAAVQPQKMRRSLVDLQLPKFQFSSRLSLEKFLKRCGIQQAWTTAADFSRIAPGAEVLLSEVLQEASIGVNETGLRMDAALTAIAVPKSGPPVPEAIVHLNRPFLMLVQDESGYVFAAGAVTHPNPAVAAAGAKP